MIHEFRRVTIVRVRKPSKKDLNQDLQWFSNSLGLFTERDKEKSCFRIFVELIKAARRGQALNSDQIALKTNLSRATIIHHLSKLIESGLVVPHEGAFLLRVDNLEALVEEIKKDVMRSFEDLKEMAEELDDQLGLLKRDGDGTLSD
ncbi:MAG: ArsR family transcriptional regulator [Candidatus Nanoarchaeia archaeon]